MNFTDTERLNWLMEKILAAPRYGDSVRVLQIIGISEDSLSGPGDVNLGKLFRSAIDDQITSEIPVK